MRVRKRQASKTFRLSLVALMLAMTVLFELLSRAFPIMVPWGMQLDFVSVPIIITFFVLGTRYATLTTVGMLGLLYVFGTSLPIGPVMKFVATLPMVLVLGIFLVFPGGAGKVAAAVFSSPRRMLLAGGVAIAVRCIVTAVVNYYWAIPFFLNMPIQQVAASNFGLWAFMAGIIGLNIVQGIVDLGLSWVVVFKFGVANRYLYSTK